MKTTEVKTAKTDEKVNNTPINGQVNAKPANGKADSTAVEHKENNPQENKDFVNVNALAEREKAGDATGTPAEASKAGIQEEEAPHGKKEPTKLEIKQQLAQEKPAFNLELTLKMVKNLSRLSNQRDKLISTIDDLDEFEVTQEDDAEETNANHFQGCVLTIEDDKGREFTTKNPFIINAVTGQIKALCMDKLVEVEGQIAIPV